MYGTMMNILFKYLFLSSQLTVCVLSSGLQVNLSSFDGGVTQNHHLLGDYGVYPRSDTFLKFRVSGFKDAHLKLMSHESTDSEPFYLINIGGWNNHKSVIMKGPHDIIDEYNYNGILVENVHLDFWISWESGIIRAGQGTELNSNTFLESLGNCPFDIKNIQIGTMHSGRVYWTFYTPGPIVISQSLITSRVVERTFYKMDNCPSFEIISSIKARNAVKCGSYCLKNDLCRGYRFSFENGICDLVSDTAINNDVKVVYKP